MVYYGIFYHFDCIDKVQNYVCSLSDWPCQVCWHLACVMLYKKLYCKGEPYTLTILEISDTHTRTFGYFYYCHIFML